jgi:hypothetical protein
VTQCHCNNVNRGRCCSHAIKDSGIHAPLLKPCDKRQWYPSTLLRRDLVSL